VDADSREIRPVIDPTLAPRQRRRLKRLLDRRANPADKLAIEYLGPSALGICVLGALLTGLPAPWLGAAAVSVVAMFLANHEIVTGALLRHRRHFVYPADLDAACWQPLHAVQRAIDVVLTSEVYRAGLLDQATHVADLRWHEWEVARRMRDITRLRAEYAESMSSRPGPQTAAVLTAHLRAVTVAQDATARRVVQLQRYANEIMAADLAMHDWRTAEHVARRNDRYLDLVARSEADEQAIAEITVLTQQAMRTRDTFQATLDQAALSAQALVLRGPSRAKV